MRDIPEAIAERMEAAAAVFADRGFSETCIEDLVHATGVPRGTLYSYFAGKNDLLAWLLRGMLASVAEAVSAAAAGPGTARERLEGVIDAQLRVMAQRPDLWRALAADAGRAGRIPEIAAAVHGAFRPVRALLAQGAADGSLRALPDVETTASAICGAVTMSGLHYLAAGGHLDPDSVGEEVRALLLGGLARAAATGARHSAAEGNRADV